LLRKGKGDGLLRMRQGTFGFYKMWRISSRAEDLLVSQEEICTVELVVN